jgi:hypothetical protein
MPYKLQHELRHVKASHLTHLSAIIDQSKSWTDLLNQMSNGTNPLLTLKLEFAHLFKRQLSCDKSPTFALLNYWAITGKRRPTILDLIKLLQACDLKRAEAFVWSEILNEEPRSQAVACNTDFKQQQQSYMIDDSFKFKDLVSVVSNISERCNRYSFASIYESTNRFCHSPFDFATRTGFKIGDGRFSSVFLARALPENAHSSDDKQLVPQVVAAKLLKSECNTNYLVNEINLAKKISHENILELLGLAIGYEQDGEPNYICLIYPYMQNGSLLECLSHGLRCNGGQRIWWSNRLDIALKIAEGIAYLHSFHEGAIIHRDIKTANILIDASVRPQLGDFTLVRQLDSHKHGETQYSQNIIGTSVYMPPEAFRGDISTKFDIFSFGVVLLELLTGLKPFDDKINEDLLTHISDKLSDIDDKLEQTNSNAGSALELRDKFLLDILDKSAGEWDFFKAKVIFNLAMKATESRKKDRPEISDILAAIQDAHGGTQ